MFESLKRSGTEFIRRILGPERIDPADYDATMIEVVEREPHALKGRAWPLVDRVNLEDGTRVAATIPPSEVFRGYIFVPVGTQSVGARFTLLGTAKVYNLHDNSFGKLEQRVEVHYHKAPTSKSAEVVPLYCL